MNNINNTDSHENAKKLISSQRDFNKYISEKNNYGQKKIFIKLFNKYFNKYSYKYSIASLIISALLVWLFLGKHNQLTNTEQEYKPEYKTGYKTEYDLDINQPIISSDSTQKTDEYKPDNYQADNYQSQQINLPDLASFSDSEPPITPEDTTKQTIDQPSHINKTITIKKNDNLTNIFAKLKINKDDLYKIITNKKINSYIKKLRPGQKIDITYNNKTGELIRIIYPLDKLNVFKIERNPNNSDVLLGNKEKLDVDERETFAHLKIRSSLFEDAQKQKLPVSIVLQLIDIFAWDIDFAQDLRKGDSVEVIYQEYFYNGHHHANGDVLAVNFNNNGRTYSAIRYDNKGHVNYYTPEGLSLRKAFIRTPVKFTRISSRFNLGRRHPLLHKIRAHRGVDYAAPSGTPIKAAGDGKIIHYGRKGGYGKTAIIQHGRKYTTLYAHMSRYNKKLRNGSTIKQGQTIGYVGKTGLATGPHLHFEFRVNGVHKNPLTVPLPKAKPIALDQKITYIDNANKMLAKIKRYSSYAKNSDNTDNTQSSQLLAANTNFE